MKDDVISAERKILKEFGFETYIEHPYKFLLHYLTVLKKENEYAPIFTKPSWLHIVNSWSALVLSSLRERGTI